MLNPKSLKPGEEAYEIFDQLGMCQYDYRYLDGSFFTCVGNSLENCRDKKQKWLIESGKLDGNGEVYKYSIAQLRSFANEECKCKEGNTNCRSCWANMELDRFSDSQLEHLIDKIQEEYDRRILR